MSSPSTLVFLHVKSLSLSSEIVNAPSARALDGFKNYLTQVLPMIEDVLFDKCQAVLGLLDPSTEQVR